MTWGRGRSETSIQLVTNNEYFFFIFVKKNLNHKNPRFFFIKTAKFFSSLFFDVYNENMFTIEIEDGREAP